MKCKNEKKEKKSSRREFVKTLSGAAASAILFGSCSPGSDNSGTGNNETPRVYGPRTGAANPFITSDGRPILVSVTGTNFAAMLNAGLDAIGGLNKLIDNNQDVLIKPNLFEKSQYPWISDVDSIIEIIYAVKNVSTGTVSVGDMSFESLAMIYNHLGIESAVNNAGGNLLTFTETYNVRRSTWDSSRRDYKVYADVYDAPILINTPVLKPHSLAAMTCAVKCNVGTIEGSAQTSSREYMHSQPDFLAELAEVAGLSNPDLNIVDARSIVTERGPFFHQNGTVVDTDKIIICGDIIAADAYCARMLEENSPGFSASSIQNTLRRGEELGLGTPDLNQVEIIEITT